MEQGESETSVKAKSKAISQTQETGHRRSSDNSIKSSSSRMVPEQERKEEGEESTDATLDHKTGLVWLPKHGTVPLMTGLVESIITRPESTAAEA